MNAKTEPISGKRMPITAFFFGCSIICGLLLSDSLVSLLASVSYFHIFCAFAFEALEALKAVEAMEALETPGLTCCFLPSSDASATPSFSYSSSASYAATNVALRFPSATSKRGRSCQRSGCGCSCYVAKGSCVSGMSSLSCSIPISLSDLISFFLAMGNLGCLYCRH